MNKTDPFKDIDKSPWLENAPDDSSKIAAVHILMYQSAFKPSDTQAYLKHTYGISDNQAKEIIKYCGENKSWWTRVWQWIIDKLSL